jgi:hypothetical protein
VTTEQPRLGATAADPVDVQSLDPPRLERFLERRRAARAFPLELSLAENLEAVLAKANELVPSAAGSILLDDPREKLGDDGRASHLTFIAAFGEKSRELIGRRIPTDQGIAGHVYLSGVAYRTSTAAERRPLLPGDRPLDALPDPVGDRHPDPHRAGGVRRPRADQPPARGRLHASRPQPARDLRRLPVDLDPERPRRAARRRRSPSATT